MKTLSIRFFSLLALAWTAFAPTQTSGEEAVVAVNMPLTLSASVVVGQTEVSIPFPVQGANSLKLDIIVPVNGATLSLRSPAGMELIGVNGVTAQFTSGAVIRPTAPLPGGVFVIENVPNPTNGNHTIVVTFPAAVEKTAVLATVLIGSEYEVGIVSPKQRYLVGEDASLGILTLRSGVPITGLSPTIKVRRKDGAGVETVLAGKDDGTGADGAANDGIYSVDHTFGAAGTYIIEGIVDISILGGSLHRTAEIEVEVVQPGLVVTQVTAPLNTTVQGCVQSIDVVFNTNILIAGDYSVSAALRAPNGNELIVNRLYSGLVTGVQSLQVSFPADDIRKSLAADGPYVVSQVTILRLTSDFEVQYENVDSLQTAAFTLSQVCRDAIEIEASLTVTPQISDGMISRLDISFPIYAAAAGSYSISLKITGDKGADVTQIGETRSLVSGVNLLTFNIAADKFQKVDGPYSVKSVLVLGNSTSAQQSLVGITTALKRWQFKPTKRGDFNADGFINPLDVRILTAQRNATVLRPGDRRDLNRDGKIDGRDLRELSNLVIKNRRAR